MPGSRNITAKAALAGNTLSLLDTKLLQLTGEFLLSLVAVCGFLVAVASLVSREHTLQ